VALDARLSPIGMSRNTCMLLDLLNHRITPVAYSRGLGEADFPAVSTSGGHGRKGRGLGSRSVRMQAARGEGMKINAGFAGGGAENAYGDARGSASGRRRQGRPWNGRI